MWTALMYKLNKDIYDMYHFTAHFILFNGSLALLCMTNNKAGLSSVPNTLHLHLLLSPYKKFGVH